MLLDGLGQEDARRFGDYELIEEIARGGMGVVWKARQLSLGRIVAVKLMLSGAFAQPEFVHRFRAEAESAASLQHPNIVGIHEIGEHDGQPFFSMDYVEGPNLAQLVRNRPLPARRAAGYLKTIAEAVHYAHEHHILHRDLKPSNILIDAADQPRITDFGLARRLTADLGLPTADLTVTGQVLGSPNYLPPEQAEARRGAVGPASDVYSLGAVLYHLLTGRAPFQAETVVETLREVTTADPVAPSLLNPSVPGDLETICLKCLEKEIPRRYPSARELAAELERFLRHEPIRARPIGATGRSFRWCKRNPRLAASLGGLLLVFAAGFAGVTWQWRRAEAERQRAEIGEAQARRNLYSADISLAMRAHEDDNRGRTLELLDRHRPQLAQEDLRGWEWRYLWRQCRGDERLTLGEFPGAATWVTFSRDNRWLAAGDISGLVRVWEMPEARLAIESLIGGGINSLAFSPDGRHLLLAHFYVRGVDLWSLLERRTVATLRPRSDQVPHHMAAFSPGGERIAIVNDDGRFEVWDALARTNLFRAGGEKTCVAGIEWSPDGRWIASGDARGLLSLRDGGTYALRWEQPCQFGMPLKTFAFSPDGEFLVNAGNDRTVRVWSARSGQLAACLTNHTAWIRAVTFTPDGRQLVTASGDQTIRFLETGSWQPLAVLRGHEDEVHAIAVSPNGQLLASGSKDGVVKLWDARPKAEAPRERRYHAQPTVMHGPVLAADGQAFLVWHADGRLEVWNTRTMELQSAATLATNHMASSSYTAFAAEGALFALGYENGTLKVFGMPPTVDSAARPPPVALRWTNSILAPGLRSFPTNSPSPETGTGISRMVFSSDGSLLATTSEDHTVRVWDAVTGQERARLDGQFRWQFALAISPDGRRVAAGNESRFIRWWRLPEGALGGELREPRLMHLRALAFSPDGRQLASASLDNRIRLWDLSGNTLTRAFSRTLLSFRSVAFTPDGRRVLAGTAAGGRIQLWNTADGQELGTLKTQGAAVSRLIFPDANALVSVTGGEVRLWSAVSEPEIAGPASLVR